MKPGAYCKTFFFEHLKRRPLEGTALGVSSCDTLLEDLSASGLSEQASFYKSSLEQARRLAEGLDPASAAAQDLELAASLSAFNLHLLEEAPDHAALLEQMMEIMEAVAVASLRARSPKDWQALAGRLNGVPLFLWQLTENARRRTAEHGPFDEKTARDLLGQIPEIVSFFRNQLPKKGGKAVEVPAARAAQAFESFARYLQDEAIPKSATVYALGEKEYAWRLRHGLGVQEPLLEVAAYGRKRIAEIHERMRDVAARLDPKAGIPELMERLGRAHPKDDAESIRLYKKLSARAKDFVLEKKLFSLAPGYRVDVVPAPPGMGDAITTAAYFPAPPFDKTRKGYFIVARGNGKPERLSAHNPYHAASTAVHEAFPGHDLQYAYWQKHGGIAPVRYLRGDPRNWGDSMNVEGYAHYTEELMREHGFFTPEEELFNLAAQAWRAVRIVVDVGLHAGGMTREEASALLQRDAFLPKPVADGEAFRYSKWPTQAVTYALGKRGIEELKAAWKKRQGPRFSEAAFHAWFLSFGPLPPAAIARSLAG